MGGFNPAVMDKAAAAEERAAAELEKNARVLVVGIDSEDSRLRAAAHVLSFTAPQESTGPAFDQALVDHSAKAGLW